MTGKYSEEHFEEMLPKFIPYLEKIALAGTTSKWIRFTLITARVSDFATHCSKYYFFAQKSETARKACGKPSVMAAAAVLMGALDTEGKTLSNVDLKKPLLKTLAKSIGSKEDIIILERCASQISDFVKGPNTSVKEDLSPNTKMGYFQKNLQYSIKPEEIQTYFTALKREDDIDKSPTITGKL
jgi:hypothetical protein